MKSDRNINKITLLKFNKLEMSFNNKHIKK